MRIRVKFAKGGSLKYIGNLDLHTIWERAARRANLPLAYSQGFHPQPKIHLASPLPLGCSSRCEVVDLRLNEEVELSNLVERLQDVLPAGIRVLSAESVDPSGPALQAMLMAAEYEVTLTVADEMAALSERIASLMGRTSISRDRRGKIYDLRPLIEAIELEANGADSPPRLHLRLSAREGATGRPDEVVEALGIALEDVRIERSRLIFRE